MPDGALVPMVRFSSQVLRIRNATTEGGLLCAKKSTEEFVYFPDVMSRSEAFDVAANNASLSVKDRLKEMKTLDLFLFRNQTQRFSESDRAHLIRALQAHTKYVAESQIPKDALVGLLETSLKMPVGLFAKGHKKVLLKLYHSVGGENMQEETASDSSLWRVEVISIDDTCLEAMDPTDGESVSILRKELHKGGKDEWDRALARFNKEETVLLALSREPPYHVISWM